MTTGENIAPTSIPDPNVTMLALEPGKPITSGAFPSGLDTITMNASWLAEQEAQAKAREAPKPVILTAEEEKEKKKKEEEIIYRHRKHLHLRLPKVNISKKKFKDKKVIRGLNTKIKPEIPGINIRELGIIHAKSKNDNVVAKIDINKINETFKTPSIVMNVMGTKSKTIMGIGLNKINKSVKVAAKININVLGKKRKIKGR